MKKRRGRAVLLAAALLLGLCSCGRAESAADTVSREEKAEYRAVPFSPETALPELYYTNAAFGGEAVFLCGTGEEGQELYRVDSLTGQAEKITLSSSGTIFCLGAASTETCLAVTAEAGTDETGIPKVEFTLYEIDPSGVIVGETALTGIGQLNLLAIGTPEVQGCTRLGDDILILINNRLLLLGADGALKDHLLWKGRPRLIGSDGSAVYLWNIRDGGAALSTVTITGEGTLSFEERMAPEGCQAFIRSFDKGELLYIANKQILRLDLESGQSEARWGYAAAPSAEKEIWYSGEDLLLELENGRVRFLRIK